MGTSLKIFKIFIVRLFCGVEYFFHGDQDSLKLFPIVDVLVWVLEQLGEYLSFEVLELVLAAFVFRRENEHEKIADGVMLSSLDHKLNVLLVGRKELEELLSFPSY